MNTEIMITTHAYLRLKERNGWNKKTSNRMIDKIYETGLRTPEIKGYLKTWLSALTSHSIIENEFVLYGKSLYIFRDKMLITVLHVPPRTHITNNFFKLQSSAFCIC